MSTKLITINNNKMSRTIINKFVFKNIKKVAKKNNCMVLTTKYISPLQFINIRCNVCYFKWNSCYYNMKPNITCSICEKENNKDFICLEDEPNKNDEYFSIVDLINIRHKNLYK
jgi:cysteinyl-tRNA synthetase